MGIVMLKTVLKTNELIFSRYFFFYGVMLLRLQQGEKKQSRVCAFCVIFVQVFDDIIRQGPKKTVRVQGHCARDTRHLLVIVLVVRESWGGSLHRQIMREMPGVS